MAINELTDAERQARQYALYAPVFSTDTIMDLLQRAWLQGYQQAARIPRAGDAFAGPLPGPLPSHPPIPVPPHQIVPTPVTHLTPMRGEITGGQFSDKWQPVYHRNGMKPCHRVALYHVGPLDTSKTASLSSLRTFPDERIPTPMDPATCGSCHELIDIFTNQDLDWRSLYTMQAEHRFQVSLEEESRAKEEALRAKLEEERRMQARASLVKDTPAQLDFLEALTGLADRYQHGKQPGQAHVVEAEEAQPLAEDQSVSDPEDVDPRPAAEGETPARKRG